MYKDAHCNGVPDILLANGTLYKPGNCWIDIYNAICNAKHFIYACGVPHLQTMHPRSMSRFSKDRLEAWCLPTC